MSRVLSQLLLFLIGIAIVFMFKFKRPKFYRPLSWKLSVLATGLYLGVLIMLVPILYMLPAKDFIKTAEDKDQAIASSLNLMNNLYNQHFPTEGDLDKLKGIYKNSDKTFKLDSSKLSFNLQPGTENYHVLIERKDLDDGEIDVSTYVTAQYVGEVNFTKRILPPTISVENGMLSLRAPDRQTFEFKQLNVDFTMAQFNNQNSSIHEMSSHFANHIIFIRVPQSLEINRGVLGDRIQII